MDLEHRKPAVRLLESTRPPRAPALADFIFGRRLTSEEEEQHKIGPIAGVPVLGLDALSSAAYGPEAALTLRVAPDPEPFDPDAYFDWMLGGFK